MITFREVSLKSKNLTDEEVIDVLKRFSQQTSGWRFMADESEEYAEHVGEASCMLLFENDAVHPAVAITKKANSIFYIANIVPKEPGWIRMSKYNIIAGIFVADFQHFIRRERILISILLSKETIGLKEIISSAKARESFERFLHGYPTSYHPSDIERLDIFICAAARFCRTPPDIDLLQRYLMEDLDWTAKDAEWCSSRIQTGLDVLRINQRL